MTEPKEINTDFSSIKWERGQTPDNIKDRCFDLCRHYLGDVWLNVTIDDIEVKRLSGGLTNQLYYCALNEDHRNTDEEVPQEVAIRLYGGKHFNNYDKQVNERLSDTIVSLLVSEHNLGPKIYGLFESGQILKYYKHKSFRKDEQKDEKLVKELAKKLAKIHALDVPIKRTGNWIFETFDAFYGSANKNYDMKALINECNCETLKMYDLKAEVDWLKDLITKTDSPITFTHVDFRGSNIMITESNGIVLCDFEYACYDYRGYDIGTIFAEWGKGLADIPKPQDFPSDSTFKPFIDSYINESMNLLGKQFSEDKRNSFDHILKEGKIFNLVSNMFFVLMIYKANEAIVVGMPFDKKKAMEACDLFYKNYYYLKNQFISNKVF